MHSEDDLKCLYKDILSQALPEARFSSAFLSLIKTNSILCWTFGGFCSNSNVKRRPTPRARGTNLVRHICVISIWRCTAGSLEKELLCYHRDRFPLRPHLDTSFLSLHLWWTAETPAKLIHRLWAGLNSGMSNLYRWNKVKRYYVSILTLPI